MNTLKLWLQKCTKDERQKLTELAGTKKSYLYFLSNPEKSYGRTASAELAVRIERAAETIRGATAESRERLPRMLRTDLAPVCRGCAFARRCLGDAAIASEFDYLDAPST